MRGIFSLNEFGSVGQAKERAGISVAGHNHGVDWAAAAVEMAYLKLR